MSKTNKKELQKQEKELKEMPLATMIIEEYKTTNKALKKALLSISIIAVILLVLFAIETTYIIIYWDSLHPYAGVIRKENCE